MFVERIAQWGQAEFRQPATPEELRQCEAALSQPLPGELRALLAEANGVEGEYGLGLVWSAERIAQDNTRFRGSVDFAELYMPFDPLVFFSDAGNGDQFAVVMRGNREVYVWNHEDDSRTWVAPTVLRFLEEWMTGRLKV
jgi:hypothetical protein